MPEEHSPATTTVEQDLRTAGQRKVNLIWEYSQAAIALSVILNFVIKSIMDKKVDPFEATIVGVVIGFYFGRTNHARIGDMPKRGLDDR